MSLAERGGIRLPDPTGRPTMKVISWNLKNIAVLDFIVKVVTGDLISAGTNLALRPADVSW